MSSTSSVTNNLDMPGVETTGGADVAVAAASAEVDVAADDVSLPQELLELRQRLDFLKNIYDITDAATALVRD